MAKSLSVEHEGADFVDVVKKNDDGKIAPHFFKNKFIRRGFVIYETPKEALRNTFSLRNNEVGNIFTAMLVFPIALWTMWEALNSNYRMAYEHRMSILLLGLFQFWNGTAVTLYHALAAVPSVYDFASALDFTGISMLFVGITIAGSIPGMTHWSLLPNVLAPISSVLSAEDFYQRPSPPIWNLPAAGYDLFSSHLCSGTTLNITLQKYLQPFRRDLQQYLGTMLDYFYGPQVDQFAEEKSHFSPSLELQCSHAWMLLVILAICTITVIIVSVRLQIKRELPLHYMALNFLPIMLLPEWAIVSSERWSEYAPSLALPPSGNINASVSLTTWQEAILYFSNPVSKLLYEATSVAPPILVVLSVTAGAMLFLYKFPERYFPNVFDYFGHSHMIWHTAYAIPFLFFSADAIACARAYAHLHGL